MNGFINLYKEKGYTSFDCVAKLRKIFGQKKIGHMGTLDPDACGVLPVALGKATRLIELFDDDRKTYRCTMLLGRTTDTLDTSGCILRESEVNSDEKDISDCLLSFIGTQDQIPPMYSALKKDGKRLYELARSGITVEREARKITVYDLKILQINIPHVVFELTCSRGTYVRSICDDAGNKLGCGACMEQLTRTAVGAFCMENSITLSELEEKKEAGNLESAVLEMTAAFPDLPKIRSLPSADVLIHNGNPAGSEMFEKNEKWDGNGRFWLFDSKNVPVGIYENRKNSCYPVKMVYEG